MTAIALIDPKHVYNVGGVVRAAACYNVDVVYYRGDRLDRELGSELGAFSHWPHRSGDQARIPRELRMYPVEIIKLASDRDAFTVAQEKEMTPVCVENMEGFEQLPAFIHPKNPMYIFGPEDGTLNSYVRHHCMRHVRIPAEFSLNLSAAVYTVLYDRLTKGI
jgi:tRNA(Leu) C34 or U34 (ribose-2'-O)-methylase TrmL